MYASVHLVTRGRRTAATSLYWFPIRVDDHDGSDVRRAQHRLERRTIARDDDDQMVDIDVLGRCRGNVGRRNVRHVRGVPIEKVERKAIANQRSEEHTSELQSLTNLVCRLLLEKKKK